MKGLTLGQLATAAECGALLVVEVQPWALQQGDVIFWAGRWRTVDHTGGYRMKDNRKVYMTATGFDGVEFIKRFDLPKYERVLKKVFTVPAAE